MTISIGKLAKNSGIGVETIRFYERRGLIPEPPRAPSGYRRYPDEAVKRLRFIRRAKELGFKLDEIITLLALQNGGDAADIKTTTQAELAQISARMRDLQNMRDALFELDSRCSEPGPVDGYPIIEALAD